jgi:di/tricarboxylate transporter
MTPISWPVNTLAVGYGSRSFSDFVKVSAPFTFVVVAVSVIPVAWLHPLH